MTLFNAKKIQKKEVPPLLNSPLVEAIFELRWEMETNSQLGRAKDVSYPMMYGSLYERLKKDFPYLEDLPSTQAHPETTPFIPRHRMRKEKDQYPLIQIGPGIVTVNMAKEYSWENFASLIERVIGSIIELFPTNLAPLNFVKAEIRYLNAIRFDLAREHPLSFLEEKMHLKVEPDAEFFEANPMNLKPNGVGVNLSYVLDRPQSNMSLSVNLGQFEGKPAFLQQTLIQSFGEITPMDLEGFHLWLDEAHIAAENAFLVLYKNDLMEKFCQN